METDTMTTIDTTLLQHLPAGLLLLTPDGRISWTNEALCRMLDREAEDLVGQALETLPDDTLRVLNTETRLYTIDGDQHWISREQYANEAGERLLLVTDVSSQEQLAAENARLRQQVEDLKLTDDLTGLPNQRAISQALELHISRSRRYQNPLSIVLVYADLSNPDGVQPLSNEPMLLALSRFLRDRLRWVDQIARWDDKVFLIVLPETTEADARRLLDKVAAEQHSMLLPDEPSETRPNLSFGLACWHKGDDMRLLLRSALQDLQQAING
jgi:diguanylate cyclase (GGDEF)-like protein